MEKFDSPFLSVPEAAIYFRIHQMTLYKLIKKGEVGGVYRLGGKWIVHKDKALESMEKKLGLELEKVA